VSLSLSSLTVPSACIQGGHSTTPCGHACALPRDPHTVDTNSQLRHTHRDTHNSRVSTAGTARLPIWTLPPTGSPTVEPRSSHDTNLETRTHWVHATYVLACGRTPAVPPISTSLGTATPIVQSGRALCGTGKSGEDCACSTTVDSTTVMPMQPAATGVSFDAHVRVCRLPCQGPGAANGKPARGPAARPRQW